MSLTLSIENVEQLDNGESLQLRLDRHGAVIGRSPHSDWSLPDPKNYVSSTHCEIDYRDGGYVLIDRSTNGTFLNDSGQRMTQPHVMQDGDLLTIGQYKVRVRTAGGGGQAAASAATAAPAQSGGWDAWSGGGGAASHPAPPASAGWETAASGWDKPAAVAADSGWAADVGAAPAAPAPDTASGWATGGAAGAASAGWGEADLHAAPSNLQAASPYPSAPSGFGVPYPAPSSAPASGSASDVWGAQGAGPAKPQASGWDSIAPARDDAAAAAAQAYDGGAAGSPISGRGALSQSWAPPRIDTPAAPPPPVAEPDVWSRMAQSNTVDWSRGFGDAPDWSQPSPPPAAAPAAAPLGASAPGAPPQSAPPAFAPPAPPPEGSAAWAAFLQASGIAPDALKADPVQAAASAGLLMKHLVAGLVVMLEARARAKSQLGAQSTTLELKGNNPIKFARSPERVLAQLLNPPERGFMGADDAVQDSFRDLQAHQMATLAAMQGALRSTLDRFSPEAIRNRAEMRGVLAKILPAARDASLWQAYEREFEGVAKGSDEAFMDVFAKAFKAAYEQAAIQMKSQGR